MKRFFLSVIIMGLLIGVGIYSLFRIIKVTDGMTFSLNQLKTAVEQQKTDQMVDLADNFEKEWEKNEKTLMHYIHRDELDAVTAIVARLGALAEHQDITELSASINSLRHLIHHICDSQMPLFKNIF